ncbi:SDR family NAD(P)-dependent oxidoreductase [Streptomyces sp. NPDC002537]
MDGNRFADKVVVVTGGGSGIGAATAYRLGREGATVIAVGRTEDKLKTTVAGAPAITALITGVAGEYGRLDVLVNNAGIGVPGTVEHTDTATWRHVFAVDVDGGNGAHIPIDGGLGASNGQPRMF